MATVSRLAYLIDRLVGRGLAVLLVVLILAMALGIAVVMIVGHPPQPAIEPIVIAPLRW